ncbi:TPA: beta-ketoacyl-[acyl-carrier-protein] synthase II [Candidatus Sumerlaeota bacterium]|jgi:3-oxoacyl-[acyl-carrier-protein] synthase II|nr:beta-ketoacyl-[acyl-carrier-protein] synthase II [Candidatus Sumerlaeota bacterium]
MNNNRRVVVTGLGAVTPIGLDVPSYWSGLCAGKRAGAQVTSISTEGLNCHIAAFIPDFNAEDYFDKKEARKNERFTQLAMVAAREASKDSGLVITEENADRCGTIIGCGIGGLETIMEQHTASLEKGLKRVSPFLIPKIITNMAAGMVAIDLNLRGPNFCVVTACASATHSIGESFHTIARGDADVMFAGGTESAITTLGMAGFSNMHALTTRNDDPQSASRPFDKERDGFLMGEGAGIIVLEELEHAKARGARIYCELAGYGASCDAHHITAPAPDGNGGARAMQAALRCAGLNPEDVDYVNAHGTSTPMNDKLETMAIKTVFGDHAKNGLVVNSTKSMIGHLLGAAGGVEGVVMALTIANNIVHPTANYTTPDPECDLDYVPNTAREMKVRAAISNSLGFGGHNATIAMKKFEG